MNWIAHQLAALNGDDFPDAVLALVTLVLIGASTWALVVGVLASIPRLRGWAFMLTPRLLRGVLFAGVAGALTVPSAYADDRGVDGLRLPDRPLVADSAAAQEATAEPVVVRKGDTLWAIARADVGADAGTAATARAAARWHAANRDVIGDDPDLVHPGQRLVPPSEDHS